MQNKRRHKRYDVIEIAGKMTLANRVEIVDIGLGGIAVKADRKLDIGREYTIRLGDKGKTLEVRCVVVRSTLSGMEKGANGESVLIYAAGMKFMHESSEKIRGFLESVERRAKKDESPSAERRLTIRFQIAAPREKVLYYPENFKVQEIDLSSMLIHSDQFLLTDSEVPMVLHLDDENHLEFIGKVNSCRKVEVKGQECYEIKVLFSDLISKDRAVLKAFINYLVPESGEGKK